MYSFVLNTEISDHQFTATSQPLHYYMMSKGIKNSFKDVMIIPLFICELSLMN